MQSNTKNQSLEIYCDGGSRRNPGPAAIGVVVKNKNKEIVFEASQKIGNTTNNVAEYTALITALIWLKKYSLSNKIISIKVYLDSNLVVNQINGKFKVKKPHLSKLVKQIMVLENEIGLSRSNNNQTLFSINSIKIQYIFIRREKNFEADALVNKALDNS